MELKTSVLCLLCPIVQLFTFVSVDVCLGPQDPHPVEVIPLDCLNITLAEQAGHPNGMQITALLKGKSRNIFVYTEQGEVSVQHTWVG